MSKLHELLAVENDLKSQATTCTNDLKATFEKKSHHFGEKLVSFTPLAEGAATKVESQSSLQSTVNKELDWISDKISKAIDAGFQIDVANTRANADVILDDGTVFLSGVPVAALMRIEHKMVDVRDLCHAIPTLDPAKGFVPDESRGHGIFKARPVNKTRTAKIEKHVVVVQPTKEHPAQVVKVNEDVPSGEVQELEWSSMITVSNKADILDRVEGILRAIKKARSRANEQDIPTEAFKIGRKILDHVFRA